MTGRSVLAIGAHPDDIELGCGGALAAHAAAGDQVTMFVVTHGEHGPGDVDQRTREQEAACKIIGADLRWGRGIPDLSVNNFQRDLIHALEEVIRDTSPCLIYTHSRNDTHQDHVAVASGTLSAARFHQRILAYESPSAIMFSASVYVDVSEAIDKKIEALMCHSTQVNASEKVDQNAVRMIAGYHGRFSMTGSAEAFEALRYVVEV